MEERLSGILIASNSGEEERGKMASRSQTATYCDSVWWRRRFGSAWRNRRMIPRVQ